MNNDFNDDPGKYIAEFVLGLITIAFMLAIVIGVFGLAQG